MHNYAFEECKNLKQISIPENVTEIQYAVFRGCESLEKIDIPDTIEKIGGNSFKWTKWYANQKDGVVYAGKVLYNYKGTMPKGTTVTVKAGTKEVSKFCICGRRESESNYYSGWRDEYRRLCIPQLSVYDDNFYSGQCEGNWRICHWI